MTTPTTILVTGDRRWSHPDRLARVLDQAAADAGGPVQLLVGDCPTGADRHVVRWARQRGIPLQVFRARWAQMAAEGRPRRAAGPLRNLAMLDVLDQADGDRRVLAFHDDLARSRGTRQLVAAARRRGYPVTLIHATGQQTLPARHREPGSLELRQAALGYAARGIPVVPLHYPTQRTRAGQVVVGCSCRAPDCGQIGKHPLAALVPHGVKDASTDSAILAAWWQRFPHANIGLATGVLFDVVDVDGPQGAAALRAFASSNGLLPRGPLVRTGGGGWHLYLAPTGLGNPHPCQLQQVDWRGRGGYVVAPPSRHASGARYRFLRDLATPLGEVPAALRALLEPAPTERPSPAAFRPSAGRGHPYAIAALEGECQRVATTPPGSRQRNHTLYRAGLRLFGYVAGGLLDHPEVQARLLAAARSCGLGEREAAATIRSAATVGLAHPKGVPDQRPARQHPSGRPERAARARGRPEERDPHP
jgi:Bifunctional DNA primase/polymerase, N-terminal/YspA, cpYpsA-related SLOG family